MINLSQENLNQLSRQYTEMRTHGEGVHTDLQYRYECVDPTLALRYMNRRNMQTPTDSFFKKLYDTTLSTGVDQLGNRLLNTLFPDTQKWMTMEMRDGSGDPEIDKEDADDLRALSNLVEGKLKASNLLQVLPTALKDFIVSTGFLGFYEREGYVNGRKGKHFYFEAVSPFDMFMTEGANGDISDYFRIRSGVSFRGMQSIFPGIKKHRGVVSETDTTDMCYVEIVAVDPRPEKNGYVHLVFWGDEGGDFSMDNMVWAREGLATSPYIAFRCGVNQATNWGDGIIKSIIPNARTLNKLFQLYITNAEVNVTGKFLIDSSAIDSETLMDYYDKVFFPAQPRFNGSMKDIIAEIPRSGRVDVGDLAIEDLRNQIHNVLGVRAINLEDKSGRAPFEISERVREFHLLHSKIYTSVRRELFAPLVQRAIDLLRKNKKEMLWLDSGKYDLRMHTEYSMLESAKAVQDLFTYLDLAKNLDPNLVALNVDDAKLIGAITSATNLNDIRRTDEEREAIKDRILGSQEIIAEQQGEATAMGVMGGGAPRAG